MISIYGTLIVIATSIYLYIQYLKSKALNAEQARFNAEINSLTKQIQEGAGDLSRWKEIREQKLRDLNKPKSSNSSTEL